MYEKNARLVLKSFFGLWLLSLCIAIPGFVFWSKYDKLASEYKQLQNSSQNETSIEKKRGMEMTQTEMKTLLEKHKTLSFMAIPFLVLTATSPIVVLWNILRTPGVDVDPSRLKTLMNEYGVEQV